MKGLSFFEKSASTAIVASTAVVIATSATTKQNADQQPAVVSSTAIAAEQTSAISTEAGENQDPENAVATSSVKAQPTAIVVVAATITSAVRSSQIAHASNPPFF